MLPIRSVSGSRISSSSPSEHEGESLDVIARMDEGWGWGRGGGEGQTDSRTDKKTDRVWQTDRHRVQTESKWSCQWDKKEQDPQLQSSAKFSRSHEKNCETLGRQLRYGKQASIATGSAAGLSRPLYLFQRTLCTGWWSRSPTTKASTSQQISHDGISNGITYLPPSAPLPPSHVRFNSPVHKYAELIKMTFALNTNSYKKVLSTKVGNLCRWAWILTPNWWTRFWSYFNWLTPTIGLTKAKSHQCHSELKGFVPCTTHFNFKQIKQV